MVLVSRAGGAGERGGDKAEVLSYFSIGVYFKGKKMPSFSFLCFTLLSKGRKWVEGSKISLLPLVGD